MQGRIAPLYIEWVDKTRKTIRDSKIVTAEIAGTKDVYFNITMRTMALNLPKQTITSEDLKNIGIKDEKAIVYHNAKPLILLGLDNAIITAPLSTRTYKNIVVSDTALGATIEGKIGGAIDSGTIGFTKEVGIELNEIISQFIEFDNFGNDTNRPILESDDNIRARTLLEKDVKRNGNKYEAPLLWKTDNIDMPNNYEYAKKRYINFERQMNYNPKLKETAHNTIKSYIEKGYIREVNPDEITNGWYLPIFANITEKKIRLVWDAAAEFLGHSLNGQLIKGPDLITIFWDIVYKLREWPIAFCADIVEMFHQIITKE